MFVSAPLGPKGKPERERRRAKKGNVFLSCFWACGMRNEEGGLLHLVSGLFPFLVILACVITTPFLKVFPHQTFERYNSRQRETHPPPSPSLYLSRLMLCLANLSRYVKYDRDINTRFQYYVSHRASKPHYGCFYLYHYCRSFSGSYSDSYLARGDAYCLYIRMSDRRCYTCPVAKSKPIHTTKAV